MSESANIIRIGAITDLHNELPAVSDELVAFAPQVALIGGDLCATFFPRYMCAGDTKHDPAIDAYVQKHQLMFLDLGLRPWLEDLAVKLGLTAEDILATAGNHDRVIEVRDHEDFIRSLPMTMLLNEQVQRHGVTFWGSPFTPNFNNWSFMAADESLASLWKQIGSDVDVALIHGPPAGMRDAVHPARGGVGSQSLRLALHGLGLPLLVCGHIHSGRGAERMPSDPTLVANASALDNDYILRDKPWMLLEYDRTTRTARYIGDA